MAAFDKKEIIATIRELRGRNLLLWKELASVAGFTAGIEAADKPQLLQNALASKRPELAKAIIGRIGQIDYKVADCLLQLSENS